MADPIIVLCGHTFERNCVHAYISLSFKPKLADGSSPDFSTIIPSPALKSIIVNWCRTHLINHPKPIDFYSTEKMVSALTHTSQLNYATLQFFPHQIFGSKNLSVTAKGGGSSEVGEGRNNGGLGLEGLARKDSDISGIGGGEIMRSNWENAIELNRRVLKIE
ncbi:RING-type E3 ubiquitin transferase [Forsythia ovata]|uniref:RING-type E3 ubiquitin transferase n=1 Tax=Forsythia ovata TaxID=205694 RepID=A0ABD1SL49_9LAMI